MTRYDADYVRFIFVAGAALLVLFLSVAAIRGCTAVPPADPETAPLTADQVLDARQSRDPRRWQRRVHGAKEQSYHTSRVADALERQNTLLEELLRRLPAPTAEEKTP